MYCPNPDCPDFLASGKHGEFVPEVSQCPYCGAHLVESLATGPANPEPDQSYPELTHEPEKVFETPDPTEAEIIKTILAGAQIPFVIEGQEQFHAFRGGHAAFRFNPHAGLVVFLVPADRAEEARALLTEVDSSEEDT